MLYARVLRSPHPHARVRSIDTSKAASLPGVKAVITHDNAPVWWGAGSIAGGAQYNDDIKKITTQRRYIFNNPVRFVGDAVAAVAAVDRHVAEEALDLIAVDYEMLPFVIDPEEALQPDAPKIWPEGNLSPNARNEAVPSQSRRGNVDEGFAAADQVFEDRYSTAFVHDAQMEPRACLAHWEGAGSGSGRGATSSRSTRRPAASPIAARHRARSRPPRRQGARSSASTWAATSATRTRTRTRT